MRDLFDLHVTRILVDDVEAFDRLNTFLSDYIPEATMLLKRVDQQPSLFELNGGNGVSIEQQIADALEKKVRLPNGGDIVIEQTESMVTVDVNTGSFVGARDQESTILETNLEAAVAIATQLRLRNLGGIIVIDFIDMHSEEHRIQVRQALVDVLARDGAHSAVGGFSQFGLLEMTRKRVRESLQRVLRSPCEDCLGDGHVASIDSILADALRRISALSVQGKGLRVSARVEIIDALRSECCALERLLDTRLEFVARPELARDQIEIELIDRRWGDF